MMAENTAQRLWKWFKKQRALRFGPVGLFYRFGRYVPVSSNVARGLGSGALSLTGFAPQFAPARPPAEMQEPPAFRQDALVQTALVVGVGPGLGHALAKVLSRQGMRVALASRNAQRLDALVGEISRSGRTARAYGCDATSEDSVSALFQLVTEQLGAPRLVVYCVQNFGPGLAHEIEVPAFEEGWRQNCLGSFMVARTAARSMLPSGQGTIVLVGSTSSVVGRAEHLNLAVGKFGQRALAQVLARELWPRGIHVAHLLIDADIYEAGSEPTNDPQADPEHIADVIHMLHRQPRSAWTSELDVRPWNEKFWEHC